MNFGSPINKVIEGNKSFCEALGPHHKQPEDLELLISSEMLAL